MLSFMLLLRDDRVVLAGLGLASASIISVAIALVTFYRDETQITTAPPKPQFITQETEDALKPDTLESLLGHYNYSIRETSARIICDRAAIDSTTIDSLLYGITRRDYEERIKCLKALALITDYYSLRLLHTRKCCSALVRCLELCMEDMEHENLDNKYYDEYFLRDMSERLCLMFISQLMAKYDTRILVETKFVEKWLARQKWGDADEEKQRNFKNYVEFKNNRLKDICKQLQESRDGRKALEKVRLISRARATELENNPTGNRVSVILEIQVPAREGRTDEGVDISLAPQPQSLAERIENSSADVRRQHREAMVLNDGTRPFERGDIIESRNRESPS
ncbi:uncharacterized protein MKZ38_006438 [Zalerion maritima]|uniref:Cytoskeleton-associated protein n=1 Tax=Zalerion maritima TaxID=339359 RepID=A0AAD5RVE0_9PEZI|nr:uncharacterized protein MKZ38_006438 [Zalerion maritima]